MMKTKVLALFLLTAILSIGLASASIKFVDANNTELSELKASADQGSKVTLSFYLKESNINEITEIAFTSPIVLTGCSKSFNSELTITGAPTSLTKNETSGLVTVTFNIPETQDVCTYTGELEVVGKYLNIHSYTIPVSITVTQLPLPEEVLTCRTTGNPNNDLSIEIDDIKVIKGFGKDNEWFPFDEVEVKINVENNNRDEKIKDIIVGWGIYNTATGEWYLDDEENDFNLKKRTDKEIVLSFKLDDDIDELEDGDYEFYVWATGEDADDNEICAYDSEELTMEIEDDFVILDDIKIVETAQCGMDVQIAGDVWNIGDDDQEDVYIMIYNKELGINQKVEIGDIDSFDKEEFSTNILISEDADEGKYSLEFRVYDEDNDIYENDYDEDEALFIVPLNVEGNCKIAPHASVSATLESEAKAGKELTIKSTITNTGTEEATYTLQASGYESWASLKDINPAIVVLGAGESVEVIYKFKVNKDVSGSKTFNIEIKTGDSEKETLRQAVSVTVEESTGFEFPEITGSVIAEDNWYLWGIGLLNVILIVIIIIVAIRVARS